MNKVLMWECGHCVKQNLKTSSFPEMRINKRPNFEHSSDISAPHFKKTGLPIACVRREKSWKQDALLCDYYNDILG